MWQGNLLRGISRMRNLCLTTNRSLLCSADLFIVFLFLLSKSNPMIPEAFPESYTSVLPRSFDLLSRYLRWLHISGLLYIYMFAMLPLLNIVAELSS